MRCSIGRIVTDWYSRHAYFESESLFRGVFFAAMISELLDSKNICALNHFEIEEFEFC